MNRKFLIGGVVVAGGLALTGCFPIGLDPTFGVDGVQATALSATGSDRLTAVTPGPGGTYYAAGFVATGTDQAFALTRFTETGTLDTTFGGGAGFVTVNVAVGGKTVEQAHGVAVQSDGKVVIAGPIEHDVAATGEAAKDTDIAVARFDALGAPDATFGTNGVKILDLAPGFSLDASNYFGDLAWGLQSTGTRTVIFGTKHAGPGRIDSDFYLAALDDSGNLDATFGTGGVLQVNPQVPSTFTFDYARNLTLQPDGKFVTAGYSLGLDGITRPVIIRANADGTLDGTFGTGGWTSSDVLGNVAEAYEIGLQGDKYVATGYGKANAADTNVDLIAYRFNNNGTRDLTFGTNGLLQLDEAGQDDRGRTLEVLPDSRILIGGSTKLTSSDLDAYTVLLTPDGERDPFYSNPSYNGVEGADLDDFGTEITNLGGVGDAWFATTLAPDGKAIYLVGYKGLSGNDDAAIARVSLENPNE